ncbi:transposase [Noviherbaspirillum sp. UKPF54]|uniref:transposase n=1 Tax=Noviherbaspirillum sp. UKPF54 TaxID=2601898 RepID=UPI0011B13873|nr:transposase [Noviherbaspirillum sp. UKPF54]QDZ28706.1 hypothetical protein FAY22_12540 [Noviherbaspirillum sp. UKPF54]
MSTAVLTEKPKLFPLRKRTGTAGFHMSKEAVNFGMDDLEKLTQLETVKFFARAMWGSDKEMPCPHCGTIDAHYWHVKELRWKCRCCGSRFSVTSKTVFADRKLPLKKILKIALSWANGASGKAALQLRRDWNLPYVTVYSLLQKLREGIFRGHNVGILCGVVEMDGADVNGRRYREKRNKPLGGKATGKPKIPEALLKPVASAKDGAEPMGPPLPPKWGKTAKQPADRRICLVARQRGVTKGKGAVATRIAMTLAESSVNVLKTARKYISAESTIMSDEDPSYAVLRPLFAELKTVNHSEGYSRPGGVSNNQSESFNWRTRRGLEGIYLNASVKYLSDYASEQAWREDVRRLSTRQKLCHLLRTALGVGISRWWVNFTHGKHRDVELLVEGNQPARGRGMKQGAKPKPPR